MVIPEIEQLVRVELQRIPLDAGYKGHNAPQDITSNFTPSVRNAA